MNSRDYWAMRSAQDMVDRMGTAEQTAAEMNKAIQQSADYIAKEVKAVFRGMESFGISESEARKILNAAGNKTALQNLRAAAQRVSDPDKRQALMSAIDSAGAYRYRITRLEQLNKDINAECRKLYQTENRAVTSALKTAANDSYYHSIFNIQQETGLGFSFAKFSQRDVDRILRANWLGGNYSQRIWKDVSATAESMKKELLVSMLSGRSNEKTARIIQDRFGVNAYCARRIVRTESAYVANAAQMSAYDEAGVEKYRFIATLDSKTSEVCAALDGKVFPAKDALPGTNYPPMHPFCRSTTIAEFGGDTLAGMERRARDKDGNTVKVPADMRYADWYRRFVDKETPAAVPAVESSADIRSKCGELKKQYSDEIKAAEKLKAEYKQLEAKVYFGDGGTDEEMKRLRQMNDEVKIAEARAAETKTKLLGAQKEYADAAGKRLVDDGIFEQVKLPKTMTPEAVDEIESKVRELYSDYGIMPKKMLFNPLKSGGTYASYRWNEDTLYLGNTIVDPERFNEYHHKTIEVFNKTQEKLRPLAEKRLAEAEKVLSDKSIKGYERHKAQLMKDQALVQLTPERNVVPDTIGEVIEHEYGHFLHNTANRMSGIYEPKKYIGMKKLHGEPEIWDSNNKSGQVAAASISKYAADNPLEAVAEAFVAKRKGYAVPKVLDDILDDIDKAVGKSLDKSAKSGIIKASKTPIRLDLQYFAVVPKEKFTKYALDPVKQPDKARAFREALGYTMDNYQDLIDNISANLDESALILKGSNEQGKLYEYVMRITGANGKQANVCTGWIIENGKTEPRLTSAYVTQKKVTKKDDD